MPLKRTIVFVFFFFVLLVHLTGVSEADPKKPKFIWKMASNAPLGIGIELYIRRQITPAIERVTDGEVIPDWYHGGIMGGNVDWVAKMHIDQLHGAILDGSGIHFACTEAVIMQLPFLFNNFDEVVYVKKRIRQRLDEVFQKNGYKMLMLVNQGPFDDVYSTKGEVRTPEDFTESRFLTYGGTVTYETLKALGASPIPMTVPEIPPSIRSRIGNRMFAVALWWVGTQLYTLGGSVTPSKMRYVMGALVVTMKAWNRTPEKHRKAIEEVILELEPGFNQNLRDSNAKSLRALFKYGLKEVKLTPGEIEVLKKKTRPVWDKLVGRVYPRELLDEILGYLEEYRSREAAR